MYRCLASLVVLFFILARAHNTPTLYLFFASGMHTVRIHIFPVPTLTAGWKASSKSGLSWHGWVAASFESTWEDKEIARWMGMYIWFERFILIFLVSVRTLEKAMHHTKRCKQTFKYSSLFFLGSRGNINIISFWASSWRFARKASSEACQMEKQKLEVQTGNDAGCIAAVELLKMLRKGIWIFTEFTFFWRLTKCWWFQWFFFKITQISWGICLVFYFSLVSCLFPYSLLFIYSFFLLSTFLFLDLFLFFCTLSCLLLFALFVYTSQTPIVPTGGAQDVASAAGGGAKSNPTTFGKTYFPLQNFVSSIREEQLVWFLIWRATKLWCIYN